MKQTKYKEKCDKGNKSPLPSKSFMRICKPTKLPADAKKNWVYVFNYLIDHAPGGGSLRDIYNSSTAVFVSMALAFVWSLLYIYLMSLFAEYIAWGIIAILK